MIDSAPTPAAAPLVYSRAAARRAARSWPRNPYAQAALSYVRRWPVRLTALWFAGYLFLLGWVVFEQWSGHVPYRDQQRFTIERRGINPEDGGALAVMISATMATFALPALVTLFGHVRERAADWRGTLVPHYRRPHLALAAVVTSTIVLITAGGFYALAPYSPGTLVAVALGIAALAGWCSSLPPKSAAVVAVVAIATFSLHTARVELEIMLHRQDPTAVAVALVAVTVALAGVWVRLALIGESTAATKANESLRLGTALGIRRRPGEELPSMSLRRRIALWHVPTSSGLLPAASGAGLLVLVVGLTLVQDRQHSRNAALAIPLACLSVILPMMAVASQWSRRLPALGYELARPVTRRAFVRDLGLALAAEWATWWGWLTAAGMAGIAFAVFYSQPTKNPPILTHLLLPPLLTGLATSVALQLFLYALLAWVMRFQTPWVIVVTALAGVLSAGIFLPYILFGTRSWGHALTATVITSVAALALLVVADAHRRWLRVDIS